MQSGCDREKKKKLLTQESRIGWQTISVRPDLNGSLGCGALVQKLGESVENKDREAPWSGSLGSSTSSHASPLWASRSFFLYWLERLRSDVLQLTVRAQIQSINVLFYPYHGANKVRFLQFVLIFNFLKPVSKGKKAQQWVCMYAREE